MQQKTPPYVSSAIRPPFCASPVIEKLTVFVQNPRPFPTPSKRISRSTRHHTPPRLFGVFALPSFAHPLVTLLRKALRFARLIPLSRRWRQSIHSASRKSCGSLLHAHDSLLRTYFTFHPCARNHNLLPFERSVQNYDKIYAC